MSGKCESCGLPVVAVCNRAGVVESHREGGLDCVRTQLAQARENGERALDERDIARRDLGYMAQERDQARERAVSAEEAYLKQGFRLDTEKARADLGEADNESLYRILNQIDELLKFKALQLHSSEIQQDAPAFTTIPGQNGGAISNKQETVEAENQILHVDLAAMTRTAANQGERADKAEAILRAALFCEAHEPIPAQPETGCPMCEAVHQADLREKAEAENRKLRESNEHWGKSPRIWHRCKNGHICTYEAVLCSRDRHGEGEDFDALVEFRALEAKVKRLREALQLILPLAKGYAAAHPVGSNQKYIEEAETLAGAE